jgi:DNA-directed RNA polymerase subunit RPC12/RpoP
MPGATCPWCGERTFARARRNNKDKTYRVRSNCDGIGWVGKPQGPGPGSGKECGKCGRRTLHSIRKGSELTIVYCSNIACTSLVVFKGKPRDR